MNKKQLQQLKNYIIENDGATIAPDGTIQSLKSGFMVSLSGFEKIYNDIKFIDLKMVKSYLKIAKKKNAFVGFWVNNNKIYIDLSINVNEKEEALKIAKKNNQIAIFDCLNLKEIIA